MFDVGDLVVCVNVDPVNPSPDNLRHLALLKKGAFYRVAAVRAEGIGVEGIPYPFIEGEIYGYKLKRFRKIDAPDTEVSRLIRACKPVREGQPA